LLSGPRAHEEARQVREAAPDFEGWLAGHRVAPITRGPVRILQVNIGWRCNLACHHCHVESGPDRTEMMERRHVERLLALLDAHPQLECLDVTGGAPELHPDFRDLVAGARALGRRVIDRCNLTVFDVPGQEDLPEFLAATGVDVVASLPCYTAENVERQRGRGVFGRSIDGLRRLNDLGYGKTGSDLRLDLVYNPVGASLPPPQAELEVRYREELGSLFGVEFDRLLTITNMPIRRFAHDLIRDGQLEAYMSLLVSQFNRRTLDSLMCRNLISVAWDGRLYDCDFNQMLELPAGPSHPTEGLELPEHLDRLENLTEWAGRRVSTGPHCFGCTAGAGSSCGGALT
jgi:radical SAM/Cys-rich protein